MAQISGGQFLTGIFQKDVRQGQFFQNILNGINQLGSAIGVDPIGQSSPPPSPDSINVETGGEIAHIQITHNSPINRGIQYFTEYSTNPQFTQPWVIDHGASRNHTLVLPTNDSTGTKQSYFFRTYAQYHGSPPSSPVVYGGSGSPTAVQMSGSTNFTLPSSTGSGTASGTGTQGGQGLGKNFTRPAAGPKRNVGSK